MFNIQEVIDLCKSPIPARKENYNTAISPTYVEAGKFLIMVFT